MKNQGYLVDLERETEENEDFRRVLFTGQNSQLVVMKIDIGDDIGEEIHEDTDQFIKIEFGSANAVLEDESHDLSEGHAVFIPAGTKHNIINTSPNQPLRIYTVYSPPEHKDGTVEPEKEK